MKWDALTPKEQELRIRCHKVLTKVKKEEWSLAAAAKRYGVSPKTVRKNVNGFVKVKGRWHAKLSAWSEMSMSIYSGGMVIPVLIPDARQASTIGRYMNAVRSFLESGDQSILAPFVGQVIRSSKGSVNTLETDPEALYLIMDRYPEEEQRPFYDLDKNQEE